MKLAGEGRLKNPQVFEAQVRRMLRDDRARALVSSFGAQWLYLRNLRIVSPDLFEFPDWTTTCASRWHARPTGDLLRKLGAPAVRPDYDRSRRRDWPDLALQ